VEGDDDGSSKTPVTLVAGEVMATGCGAWGSGLELKRASSPGQLAELTLGPFGTQYNWVVT
jgi:hypothetical protein